MERSPRSDKRSATFSRSTAWTQSKVACDHPGLVRLQAADEMPGQGEVAQLLDLLHGLLHITFPDVPDSRAGDCPHAVGRLTLAHAQECDGVDIPQCGLGGPI